MQCKTDKSAILKFLCIPQLKDIVATVEAKVDDRVMFFDGTRRLTQFGCNNNN